MYEDVAVGILTVGLAVFVAYVALLVQMPRVVYDGSKERLRTIVDRCPTMHRAYWPTIWACNAHLQILLLCAIDYVYGRRHPSERQVVSHDDGGETAIDWYMPADSSPTSPIVVYLHTIMGDAVPDVLVDAFAAKQWRTAILLRRGHGSVQLRTPLFNMFGSSTDVHDGIACIRKRFPSAPLLMVGMSAGAAVAVRYLGEYQENTPIKCAAILSPGYALRETAQSIHHWYDWYLVGKLKDYFITPNKEILSKRPGYDQCVQSTTVFEFMITSAKLVGFQSPEDYFEKTCPMVTGENMRIPFVMVQATDDPICPEKNIPYQKVVDNGNGVLVTVGRGSHCAFYEGIIPRSWMAQVTTEFLDGALSLST
ncbi:unnamed protein product (mitochondrion) [Plasmodiophora brassicae]|uniref:Serine aminopeptidase S33 domain-containing protein n=1 Tax=Plasmodiophora brassicae TaxID=37360 RepID=A0A0G4IX58_PLABS|nr:hypothetical protein PBRA_007672 [Plasmodiophora brassicae]SPQ99568.1 unnamed protein product [Plasmodiophora brassicae]